MVLSSCCTKPGLGTRKISKEVPFDLENIVRSALWPVLKTWPFFRFYIDRSTRSTQPQACRWHPTGCRRHANRQPATCSTPNKQKHFFEPNLNSMTPNLVCACALVDRNHSPKIYENLCEWKLCRTFFWISWHRASWVPAELAPTFCSHNFSYFFMWIASIL